MLFIMKTASDFLLMLKWLIYFAVHSHSLSSGLIQNVDTHLTVLVIELLKLFSQFGKSEGNVRIYMYVFGDIASQHISYKYTRYI